MDDIALQKHRRLVERLYQRTRERRIDWSGEVSDVFMTHLGEYYVEISTQEAQFEALDYVVRILTADGTEVERFTDVDIAQEDPTNIPGLDSYYKIMRATYGLVQRQLSGADVALDSVLDFLD